MFAWIFLVVFLFSMIPQVSSAIDCNSPPGGYGGSWARKYKEWCESCGGRYNASNQSCIPGPNRGGGSSYPSPAYDYEAERRRQEEEQLRREDEERRRQQEIEAERKREEEEARIRQEKFERDKQEALIGMKGIDGGGLGRKEGDSGASGLKDIGDVGAGGLGLKEPGASGTGGLGLKEIGGASMGPSEGKIRADIDSAGRRIPELRKEIQGLQALLRQFGASQRGNVSELEKWDDTFREAAENSRKNAVDYGMSMFLQYNLLGSLEGKVKQDAFRKLDELINSSDPAMRRWLGEQLKKRNVELERVQRAVTIGSLGGDFASLFPGDMKTLKGDLSDTGKALDSLLFVNDLLEASKVVRWSGSQYFQQAKMIGETYTDLAAFGFSVANVRKANKAVETYNREIRHLSRKLGGAVKEMNCLEKCLDAYADRCLDRCTGRTRFGSPPPSPRVVGGRN
jgi:hypothetical protein